MCVVWDRNKLLLKLMKGVCKNVLRDCCCLYCDILLLLFTKGILNRITELVIRMSLKSCLFNSYLAGVEVELTKMTEENARLLALKELASPWL